MEILVYGKRTNLSPSSLIGKGGEGVVFRSGNEAIKIYHTPSRPRIDKLNSIVGNVALDKARVASPSSLVHSTQKSVIGFTMPYFGVGCEDVAGFSNRGFRNRFAVTTKQVVDVFLDGAKSISDIHSQGMVIGDLNDENTMFKGSRMLFVDVDAWRYGQYPCVVGTEAFVDPALYGIDFRTGNYFEPEHDWYSYTVMLFKSLVLAHPYGGVHKTHKTLTDRAMARVSVVDPTVRYPTIAISPNILSDELLEYFENVFTKGTRGIFPVELLRRFGSGLTECPSCGIHYHHSRKHCPACSEATIVMITKPTVSTHDFVATTILTTNGPIIFQKKSGGKMILISNENGKCVLYEIRLSDNSVRKVELFGYTPGSQFEYFGGVLAVNLPYETSLMLVDVRGDAPKALSKTETAMFLINRRAMMGSSGNKLFRIAGQTLLSGSFVNGNFVERAIRTVTQDQTWFTVNPDNDSQVFGLFQVMGRQMYWLVADGAIYDIALSELSSGEYVREVTVRFSDNSVLVRRIIESSGKQFIVSAIIEQENGRVGYESSRIETSDHPFPNVHGQAYWGGKALVASDDGIIQEDVATGAFRNFDGTKKMVADGDSLYRHGDNILAVSERQLISIKPK